MPNIFKIKNKDTKTMSGASIVIFEHVSHFILLLVLLSLSKLMPVGPEKLQFQTVNLFSVAVRNILSYGLGKFVGYIFSCLFIQYKVAKGYIFTTVLQKNKSNPVVSVPFFSFCSRLLCSLEVVFYISKVLRIGAVYSSNII